MTITQKRALLAGLGLPPDPKHPSYVDNPDLWMEATAKFLASLTAELERYSQVNDAPTADAYTLSNVTVTRTLDADSTTTAELADVLSTLIQDLQSKGTLP